MHLRRGDSVCTCPVYRTDHSSGGEVAVIADFILFHFYFIFLGDSPTNYTLPIMLVLAWIDFLIY